MSETAAKYRLTTEQFLRIGETGVFPEGTRVELVDGEIVEMSPTGPRHGAAVSTLLRIFRNLWDHATLRVQDSMALGEGDLREPDFVIARARADMYAHALPRPADVLLLVQVSDSSLPDDRGPKRGLYARHRIPEYWIVNLVDDRLEVHRDPADGGWRDRRILAAGDTVAPLAFPDHETAVAGLFPAPGRPANRGRRSPEINGNEAGPPASRRPAFSQRTSSVRLTPETGEIRDSSKVAASRARAHLSAGHSADEPAPPLPQRLSRHNLTSRVSSPPRHF